MFFLGVATNEKQSDNYISEESKYLVSFLNKVILVNLNYDMAFCDKNLSYKLTLMIPFTSSVELITKLRHTGMSFYCGKRNFCSLFA